MSKLHETSEDITKFIEKIIDRKTTLSGVITWRILSDETQKELIKITKSSAVTEYFAKMSDSIIIYVNEVLFDKLKPTNVDGIDYRQLLIEDALATVQLQENEKTGLIKIIIAKPQICITSNGYSKFGENLVHAAETVVMAYEQLVEEEKQRKIEAKEMQKMMKKKNY